MDGHGKWFPPGQKIRKKKNHCMKKDMGIVLALV
jgi:hypothetical protein